MVARNASNVVQREELQITIMLISVIIVFFICQAPYVIYTAIVSITKYGVSTAAAHLPIRRIKAGSLTSIYISLLCTIGQINQDLFEVYEA